MAITDGSLIEITNVGLILGQTVSNVWQYRVEGSPGEVTASQLGEAWWSHVKAVMRAVPANVYPDMFREVRVAELDDPLGEFGTFAIPVLERSGTRAPGASSQGMPPFAAVGVKLTVSTRVTRPGQKRLAGLVEEDQSNGVLIPAVITAANALMAVMAAQMTLGAPAALTVLEPVIVRRGDTGLPVAYQEVEGGLVNSNVTTQNSRKIGRGI